MTTEQAFRDSGQTLELPDGRRLGYAEWGDPAGKPVLYFHGLHSSRLALYQTPEFFTANGIRFITIDRPGIGLSTFQRGRTLLDWPGDVARLADALGLAQFAILSMTSGGMYALACAARMPDRLMGVACVSPSAPLDAPGITVSGVTGRFLWLAQHAPWALWTVYALLVPRLRRDPERVYRMLASGVSESGLRALENPVLREIAVASVLEAFRSGYWGETRDVEIAARPWGLRLEDIPIVVHLWDGDENNLVPPGHREYLARVMPRAQTRICHGEGQLLIVGHMAEIIQGIIESDSAGSATA